MPFELPLSFVTQLLSMPPSEKRRITDNFHQNRFGYSSSRGFSLAWLLALTKSFASLVIRISGLFYAPSNKQTNYVSSHVNNFTNAKSHKREKPLLAV